MSDAPRVLMDIERLSKHFPIHSTGLRRKIVGYVKACDEVSFQIYPGETLAIVGESGSGKSTLARSVLRAIAPTSGRVLWHGDTTVDLAKCSAAQLRALRPQLQMIFQDPFTSLNPRFTVEQIIGEPLIVQGVVSRSEREDRVVRFMRRVGLRPEYRTRYPHAFSGGQRQRIGIARALVSEPKLVVADEAVSALDVAVQAQIVNLLRDLQEELNLTYLFIAHDLAIVRHLASRVAVMKSGQIVELGHTQQVYEAPQHPYTRQLLSSVLSADPDCPSPLLQS